MENPLISIFDCTVCLDVPNDNVKIFQCSRGHLLCQSCHSMLINCPSCNEKLGFIRCLVAEKYLHQVFDIKIEKWDDIRCEFGEMKRRHDLEIKEVEKKHEIEIKKFNAQLVTLRNIMRYQPYFESTLDHYLSDKKGFLQVYIGGSELQYSISASIYAIYWGQYREDLNSRYSVFTDRGCKCSSSNETISKTRSVVKAVVHTIGMAENSGIEKLTINLLETTDAYIHIFRYMNLAKLDRSYWIDVVDDRSNTYAHDFEMLDIILENMKNLQVKFDGVSGDHKQMARALHSDLITLDLC